jgi:hypothetical protein
MRSFTFFVGVSVLALAVSPPAQEPDVLRRAAVQIVPASLAGGVGSAFTNGGETLHQGVEVTGHFVGRNFRLEVSAPAAETQASKACLCCESSGG